MRLWSDLARYRDIGMQISPFSWRDFAAYTAVTGEKLSSADLSLITVIEDEFHASRHDAEGRRKSAAEARAASESKRPKGRL